MLMTIQCHVCAACVCDALSNVLVRLPALVFRPCLQVQNMFMNPSTFETDPEEFIIDFNWMDWANFDLEKGLACLVKGAYGVVFLTFIAIPFLVGLFFLVMFYATRPCCHNKPPGKYARPSTWEYFSAYLTRMTLVVIYVLYAMTSRVVLQTFHCKEFQAELASDGVAVTRLYAADFNIICNHQGPDGRYSLLLTLAVVFTIVFPAGGVAARRFGRWWWWWRRRRRRRWWWWRRR